MEQFFYNNIFETKGIEYLAIIAFFLILIPFWYFLNKKIKVKKILGVLSSNILKIPQGLFYSKNHTWIYMEKYGTTKIGLDDLLLHITGDVKINNVKNIGEKINKGELIAEITQDSKTLKILSPISGEILSKNKTEEINEDPYNVWIYKIKPSNWKSETKDCYFAEDAKNWCASELNRFKDFLSVNYSFETSKILQDGGELYENTLSDLPDNVWKDFEKEFMNL
jgi:glycine cleavage system H protein